MKSGGLSRIVFLILIYAVAFKNVYAEVLTLPQGLNLAVQESRLVKIAKHEEGISAADTMLAKSPLYPSVSASLSQTFLANQPGAHFGALSVYTSEKDYHSLSLSIQYILYDFMGNASRYDASKVILKTKLLDTIRIRNLAALEFALIYFDLLETEKMIAAAEKEAERLESHLRDAKHMYDSGVITKNDLLQADVRLSDARQKVLSAKNMRAVNAARVNNALSRPLEENVQTVDLIENHAVIPENAYDAALRQRPEILITDETMTALNLEEKAKKSEYYPKFIVKAGYDFTDNQYQIHEDNLSLTLGMSFSIYNGNSTKAGLLKIESRKLQLAEQKSKIEDSVRLEVKKYSLDMQNARERIAVTKHAEAQADENLRINKIRYKEGVGTATDVLDSVALLTVAETNYLRAIYDLKRAEAALLYSTGMNLAEVYK